MAGVRAAVNSGEVSVLAATAKTVLQIVAATNHRTVVKGFGIWFKGTSPTDTPVKIRVLRQTTAGTMTAGSSGTEISKKNSGDDETLQTTVRTNASAEPTPSDVLYTIEVHPQTGYQVFLPFGEEIAIVGGARLGWEVTAAQAQTCVITADVEE